MRMDTSKLIKEKDIKNVSREDTVVEGQKKNFAPKAKKIGFWILALPNLLTLVIIACAFIFIKVAPDLESTVTLGFWAFILFYAAQSFFFPLFMAYCIFLWLTSHFMSTGRKKYIKIILSFVGILSLVIFCLNFVVAFVSNLFTF